MKSLTIKQLEACRDLYRDDMEKQYVIDVCLTACYNYARLVKDIFN